MNWYEHWYDYTGTFSDWVMAGAAAYAAWSARTWFKQSQLNLGFEYASKFLSNIEKAVKTAIDDSYSIHDDIHDLKQNKFNEDSDIYSTLKNKYYMTYQYVKELSTDLDSINRMGVVDKKSPQLKIILDNLRKCAFNNLCTIDLFFMNDNDVMTQKNLDKSRPLANKCKKAFDQILIDKKEIWDIFQISK
jgi:hypothetical protein